MCGRTLSAVVGFGAFVEILPQSPGAVLAKRMLVEIKRP